LPLVGQETPNKLLFELYEEAAKNYTSAFAGTVSGERENGSYSGCTYMTMILRCQAFFDEIFARFHF